MTTTDRRMQQKKLYNWSAGTIRCENRTRRDECVFETIIPCVSDPSTRKKKLYFRERRRESNNRCFFFQRKWLANWAQDRQRLRSLLFEVRLAYQYHFFIQNYISSRSYKHTKSKKKSVKLFSFKSWLRRFFRNYRFCCSNINKYSFFIPNIRCLAVSLHSDSESLTNTWEKLAKFLEKSLIFFSSSPNFYYKFYYFAISQILFSFLNWKCTLNYFNHLFNTSFHKIRP